MSNNYLASGDESDENDGAVEATAAPAAAGADTPDAGMFYMVTGRVPDDDEPIMYGYKARDRDHAIEQFMDEVSADMPDDLRSLLQGNHGTFCFVDAVFVSTAEIKEASFQWHRSRKPEQA